MKARYDLRDAADGRTGFARSAGNAEVLVASPVFENHEAASIGLGSRNAS